MSPRSRAPKGKNPESGYALLLIFAMAAIVAITLYTQVPGVAFEAQRDKEQLLIDRGQQYSRAIALFVRKFNRFPTTMEELENTNNMRFLRRRYPDPMTGKTDWRILHAGPGGVITDSITAVKKPDGSSSSPNNFITDLGPMTGAATPGDAEGVNMAKRIRPSDQAGAPGDTSGGGGGGNLLGSDPNPGAGGPGNTIASNSGIGGYNGPVMVLPDGRIVPANSTGTAPPPGQQYPSPGPNTGVGAPPIVPNGAPLPTGVAIQQNTQNGQNTPPLPSQVGAPPGGAASLINQILTSPRPGGLNGLNGGQGIATPGVNAAPSSAPIGGTTTTSSTSAPQQQIIGAGLAGVASKKEQEGIKSYNDRVKYNEWEFVYDITKDPTKVGQGGIGQQGGVGPGRGGPPGQPGAPGQPGGGPLGGAPGIPPMAPGPGR